MLHIVFYSTLDRGHLLTLKSGADTFFSYFDVLFLYFIIKILYLLKKSLFSWIYYKINNIIKIRKKKNYFRPANFTFDPQILLSSREFYFRHAKFTFDPQIRFAGNICNFRRDFRVIKCHLSHTYRNVLFCILCVNFNFTHSNDTTTYFTHTIKKYIVRHTGEIFTTSWSPKTRAGCADPRVCRSLGAWSSTLRPSDENYY